MSPTYIKRYIGADPGVIEPEYRQGVFGHECRLMNGRTFLVFRTNIEVITLDCIMSFLVLGKCLVVLYDTPRRVYIYIFRGLVIWTDRSIGLGILVLVLFWVDMLVPS